jgi:hypothetical protein
MKTLKTLQVPQDGNDLLFPDGQILNETITNQGTPVVRELYGDIITNVYKIVRDAGLVFNGNEDNEVNGYQLLDALKLFVNNLNDKRQVLTVSSQSILTGFNFDVLPDEYIFIGVLSDALSSSEVYNMVSGNGGALSIPVNSTSDIQASSTVLIVLNRAGTTVVDLSSAVSGDVSVNVSFGTPLSFNESTKAYYFRKGIIFNDFPKSFSLEGPIAVLTSNNSIEVLEVIFFKGRAICLTIDTVLTSYRIFSFLESSNMTLEGEVTFTKTDGTDNYPYMYCDGSFIYFTNSAGSVNSSANNNDVSKQNFDENTLTLSEVSSFSIDSSFQKTTNVFVDSNSQLLYTFIQNVLTSYPMNASAGTQIGFFPGIDGIVFKLGGSTYYSNGNTSTKWQY